MLTDREQKVIEWLRKRKVATMRHLRHQFRLSHMTVVRALKKCGYYTSYNHNAAYYVLQELPQFNEWGLWTYRDIGFSKYGTLTETIIGLVENASAGLTVAELEERLRTQVANLVSRLVRNGAIQRETLRGRQAIYLASDAKLHAQQRQQRQESIEQMAADRTGELPEGCSPTDVIEVLRQMIVAPGGTPEQLARQLKGGGVHVTAGQIRRMIDYYALEKKRQSSR